MENLVKDYAIKNYQETLQIIRDLCAIPAPSYSEDKRAEFCKNWLEQNGAKGVYIDKAKNVVFPINCENSNELTVFVAHTDTVFPDTTPMPFVEDDDKMYCPGVSDDTASVAVLLMGARYLIQNNIKPKNGVLIVLNSCEEGLGNLMGTRQIFSDYQGRIAKFIAFDGSMDAIYTRCVGSIRYEVEVLTKGGHSYWAFGTENAIERLSYIVSEIYKMQVPLVGDSKSTYNVGTIIGGTSVNTVAQNAKMLCECRSTHKPCLEIMTAKFNEIFDSVRSENVQVKVKEVGNRPCEDIEYNKVLALAKIAEPIIKNAIGKEVKISSGSTDCNIPLSLGIPAICVGVSIHGGVHTREEWLDKKSVLNGLQAGVELLLAFTK